MPLRLSSNKPVTRCATGLSPHVMSATFAKYWPGAVHGDLISKGKGEGVLEKCSVNRERLVF